MDIKLGKVGRNLLLPLKFLILTLVEIVLEREIEGSGLG